MNTCPYERTIRNLFISGTRLGNDFHKTAAFLCKHLGLNYQRLTYGTACNNDTNRILTPQNGFPTIKELEYGWNCVDPEKYHVTQRRHYWNNGIVIIAETIYKNPTSLYFDWTQAGTIAANTTLGLENLFEIIDINHLENAFKITPAETKSLNRFLRIIKNRMNDAILTDGLEYRLNLEHLHQAIHLAEEAKTKRF